ncbi:MAG TPA: 30S ribosomal protein S16 [Longimicrobium sp.]|jgi:small subunit ribosomal protein S16
MALKIRLRRMGRKKAPHYRIVIAESSNARDGRFVANIGHYNPTTNPMTLVVDRDKALFWLGQGATPTDTVNSLLKKGGVFQPAPTVVENVAAAATGAVQGAGRAAKGAAGAVAGAASAAAGAVTGAASTAAGAVSDVASSAAEAVTGAASSAASAVADTVRSAVERVTGGGDDAPAAETADAPAAEGAADATEENAG